MIGVIDEIKKRLMEAFSPEQAEVLTDAIRLAFDQLVKASDFAELKAIVAELAKRMDELAEAQKQTENRLNELAERFIELTKRVDELTEAQKETERQLRELARRTDDLAEAQRRTEEELRKLIQEHRETRRQLGGLAITVGYTLENEAFKALPKLLERDFGIKIKGRLKRAYIKDKEGKPIEVNIIGKGVKDGRELTILGEGKAQLSKRDVDRFLRRKVDRLKDVLGELFLVLVTHMTSDPEVEDYVREKGIALYFSYDF